MQEVPGLVRRNLILPVVALVMSGLASTANATVYDFTATGSITSAVIPGTMVGDIFTINVFADNGNSTDLSQSWSASDVSDFTLSTGTYFVTYSAVRAGVVPLFSTDSVGLVTVSNFFGTSPSSVNTDNFGTFTGDLLFGNEFCDTTLRCSDHISERLSDSSNWTAAPAVPQPIPEPTSLALLGAGLASFAFLRRRRAHRLRGAM